MVFGQVSASLTVVTVFGLYSRMGALANAAIKRRAGPSAPLLAATTGAAVDDPRSSKALARRSLILATTVLSAAELSEGPRALRIPFT